MKSSEWWLRVWKQKIAVQILTVNGRVSFCFWTLFPMSIFERLLFFFGWMTILKSAINLNWVNGCDHYGIGVSTSYYRLTNAEKQHLLERRLLNKKPTIFLILKHQQQQGSKQALLQDLLPKVWLQEETFSNISIPKKMNRVQMSNNII